MQHLRDSPGGITAFLNNCCNIVVTTMASGMANKVSTIVNPARFHLLLPRGLQNYQAVHFYSSSLPDRSESKVLQSSVLAEALLLVAQRL